MGNTLKKKKSEGQKPPELRNMFHSKKGEEVINILRKGADFAHDLLKENEKLRYQLAQIEEEGSKKSNPATDTELKALRNRLQSLEDEKSKLMEKFKEVEKENQDFANKYVEIEHENNMLANLYIASYQLHSTLDIKEVLTIIMEVIINLIGAEQFALFLFDEKSNILKSVASEGIDDLPIIKFGEGVIGEAAKSGTEYFKEDMSVQGTPDPNDPLVCIPMKIKERVIGTIVIYKLLTQKDSFNDLDYEMFSMLAGHTATAIFSSKLYTESERKLSTIQGFIDLLTKN